MILLARALARLVSFLLLVALAIAGLALAIFCIGTGTSGPSLGGLASTLHLPALRDTVGDWLAQLEASGPVAGISALAGLAAIALGLLLLAGLLMPSRERLVILSEGEGEGEGTLAARPRPLAQTAQTLAEQVRGVTEARVSVRPRRAGGRLRVRASRTRPANPEQVRNAVTDQLGELTAPFKLRARVDVTEQGGRVQ